MIRVLLVDDQPLVRAGLARIFSPQLGLTVVGECSDGDEVIDALAGAQPDVIVMDIRMKRVDGVAATAAVRAVHGPPVLILTTFDDDELLSGALRAGAAGFQLKDAPGEDIVRAVEAVAGGGAWLDPGVTGRVLAAYRSSAPDDGARAEDVRRLNGLTARELDVLRLIGRGAANAEIAAELYVSEATVKSHVSHILQKLALRDRAAAIVFAFDHGVVTATG